jgi:hypothetical protein
VSIIEALMTIEDYNKILILLGEFADLGDLAIDDPAVARFRAFDKEDKEELAKIVREAILPGFLDLDRKRQDNGLSVLKKLAALPGTDQEDAWLSLIPPFDYPTSVNLFALMYDILSAREAGTR